MKKQDIDSILNKIWLDGYESEVPLDLIKKHIAPYRSYDKYKIKSTIEVLVEIGILSWVSVNVMKIEKTCENKPKKIKKERKT